MRLGEYPTPVQQLVLGGGGLWVKHDDRTNPRYGGNKVRKLERVLARAEALGARRIVTVGAAGSHHAVATALFARDLGIEVEAVLVPQPRTDHVAENLRIASRLARVLPATSFAHAATIVLDRVACGAHYVPPGGSTLDSSLAYADAAGELLEQVARGELPMPEIVVVPLGSGGTAAGLAAGFAQRGADVRVVGVLVAEPRRWVVRRAQRMMAGCARAVGLPAHDGDGDEPPRLVIDERYLGGGYGHPTLEGARAIEAGARVGLTLDPTYTAKAFAAALALVSRGSAPVLYWHTLSSAPLAPLLEDAPQENELRGEELALLLPMRT